MSREPCRISDDSSYDYSDYIEQKGVYEPYRENDHDADDKYDEWRSTQTRNPKTGSLEPLITPHVGDKDENH